MPELWSVFWGEVVKNESEAGKFIDSQSIYASGDKVKLIEDLTMMVGLLNSLNIMLNHQLFDSASRFRINPFLAGVPGRVAPAGVPMRH